MKKEEVKPLLNIGTVIEATTTSFGGIKATVTDVQTITSEKNKDTEFMYEFENTGEYIKVDEMTGDKLFEIKSKCYGAVSAASASASIRKIFEKISEAEQCEQDMLLIRTMSNATDYHMNAINARIKTICEHENINTAHLISIVRCDLASGKSLDSVLKWLQTRIENYSENAGVRL